jgi:hypothetical protein
MARDGILSIEDGPVPESIELDATHLQAGTFTYARKGGRIDVTMTLIQPEGDKVREATSFLGQPTAAGVQKDYDQLRQEVGQLKSELEQERARNNELQKRLRKPAARPR